MLADIGWAVFGLASLIFGAEALVRGSSSLALRLGISPVLVGLTVVAWGTSAPELLVSLSAVGSDSGGMALGNVVGSNITNVAVILGLTALVRPLRVESQLVRIDTPFLIAVSLLTVWFIRDFRLTRWEGAVLVALFVAYTLLHLVLARRGKDPKIAEGFESEVKVTRGGFWIDLVLVAVGIAFLGYGSDRFVHGAIGISQALGVSDAIIGLTVVAIGTSMPELVTTLAAAWRGSADIATGNIVGSCISNLLAILGLTALIHPFQAPGIETMDLLVMFLTSLLLLPLFLTGLRLGRREGFLLLAIYGAYLWFRWPH